MATKVLCPRGTKCCVPVVLVVLCKVLCPRGNVVKCSVVTKVLCPRGNPKCCAPVVLPPQSAVSPWYKVLCPRGTKVLCPRGTWYRGTPWYSVGMATKVLFPRGTPPVVGKAATNALSPKV